MLQRIPEECENIVHRIKEYLQIKCLISSECTKKELSQVNNKKIIF